MIEVIKKRIQSYDCKTLEAQENVLKELIQEISLFALWRAKFFEKAAFYGGTSLRILYGLPRFSEDLDFTLLVRQPKFSLVPYEKEIETSLNSFGFDVTVNTKVKENASQVESAFLKAETTKHLLMIESPFKGQKGKLLKIKLEVDKDPPDGFKTEAKYLYWPSAFSVTTYDMPSLFAGKLHATLCRERIQNIKGRDWYDFLWYIAQNSSCNLFHLEQRMRQSGHWDETRHLELEDVQNLLNEKIEALDFAAVKRDIKPFIKDARELDAWGKPLFLDAIRRIRRAPPAP